LTTDRSFISAQGVCPMRWSVATTNPVDPPVLSGADVPSSECSRIGTSAHRDRMRGRPSDHDRRVLVILTDLPE
jgi:hypothetical protein